MLSLMGTALVRYAEDPVRRPLGFGCEVTKNVVAFSGGYTRWRVEPTHLARLHAPGMEVTAGRSVGQRRWTSWDVVEDFAEVAIESGH